MQKLKTPYIASTPPDFLWARRILAAVVVLALLLGIAASIDAISSSLSTPERTVRTTTGQAFELYGEIPASSDGMRPAVRFDIRPSAPQIVVNRIDFHPTRDQRSLKWTATLMALPGTPSGFYNIRPASSSAENLPGWHLDLYATQKELQSRSASFFMREFGADALNTALNALVAALVAGLALVAVRRRERAARISNGLLRVEHVREDGDDTLLFCRDSTGRLELSGDYAVLTASGQHLGSAQVVGRTERGCTLRLTAARARPGCLVLAVESVRLGGR